MSGIGALDRLGEQLGDAVRAERRAGRRRRRLVGSVAAAALAVAVPAAGTATEWAGLAGGETPLPVQVADGGRATLAAGVDGRGAWSVEAYRAALSGRSAVGVCVFTVRRDTGAGRCAPVERLGPLTTSLDAAAAQGLVGGTVRGPVSRVEVTVTRSVTPTVRVIATTPPAPEADLLRARDLPDDLRAFVVLLGDRDLVGVRGVRALDRRGATVALAGRPAPPAPSAPARRTPAIDQEVSP
ncbi:hypothetical protein [Paraconexibacter algicola]|uniref:Uncharacterized protein n=1 Tax=Paraconexibacter algicola TaxID=2133960 RepID=A0A2T4UIG2_9ACTN|nr:hypothetical protein [Paraconexibacter algicola]PTL59033.1 hypothetical protein C7Y72_04910 [Paraconexibacter algicola]